MSDLATPASATTIAVNLIVILSAGYAVFRFVRKTFDHIIDTKVQPELQRINSRIDNHMVEEETSLHQIAKNHRKLIKKIAAIETRAQAQERAAERAANQPGLGERR